MWSGIRYCMTTSKLSGTSPVASYTSPRILLHIPCTSPRILLRIPHISPCIFLRLYTSPHLLIHIP